MLPVRDARPLCMSAIVPSLLIYGRSYSRLLWASWERDKGAPVSLVLAHEQVRQGPPNPVLFAREGPPVRSMSRPSAGLHTEAQLQLYRDMKEERHSSPQIPAG